MRETTTVEMFLKCISSAAVGRGWSVRLVPHSVRVYGDWAQDWFH